MMLTLLATIATDVCTKQIVKNNYFASVAMQQEFDAMKGLLAQWTH